MPESFPVCIVTGPDGALWFTEPGAKPKIGRITTSGLISEYTIPAGSNAGGIAAGPDGAVWFTEQFPPKIGRISTAGVITQYPLHAPYRTPQGIVAGPDGALWFTEDEKIGRITTKGVVVEYSIPTSDMMSGDIQNGTGSIVAGPDGALWFTEMEKHRANPHSSMFSADFRSGAKIGRITTSGVVTEYAMPPNSELAGIAAGPDGALWFTEHGRGKIGRITTSGVITEYATSTANSGPHDSQTGPGSIVAGPDGALWFTDSTKIGRLK
jgi:virginiamycin B lyase